MIILLYAEGTKELNYQIAHIDYQNNDGKTALMFAVINGNIQVVQALVTHGADIHIQDNDGTTALMFAVENLEIEAVRALVNYGANIHVQDNTGRTALSIATEIGNMEILHLLQKIADARK